MALPPFKQQFPQRFNLSMVCVLLLCTILYLYQLGTESLWFDEAYSIESALGSLNLNRPLYFLMLRFWMRLGEGEAWLRGLSVLWGLVSAGLIYLLGKQVSHRKTGVIAALLFTLSPLAINHAQEVRFYMLSTALGLAGSLCLACALKIRKLSLLSGWILFRLLALLTAQVNLLLLLPDLLLLMLKGWQVGGTKHFLRVPILKQWGWLLGVFLIPLAFILRDIIPPLLDFASQTYTLNGVPIARPGLVNIVGALATFTAWPLRAPRPEWVGFYQPFYNIYALVVVGVLVYGLYRQRLTPVSWAAAWGLIPFFAIFAVAQLFIGMWGDRYLLIAAPYCFILLAEGIRLLWSQHRKIAMIVMVLYAIAVGSALVRYYTVQYRHDWRGLVQTIQTHQQPGDRLLLYPDYLVPNVTYYYRNTSDIHVIERNAEVADTQNALAASRRPGQRYWVVFPQHNDWNTDATKLIEVLRKAGFTLQSQQVIRSQWGEDIELSLAVPK
jgi:uncharacterized membrane protein